MKDTYISLALSITVHLCIIMLLVVLSPGSRKLDKAIVADLTLMTGQERAETSSPVPWSNPRGGGVAKGATKAPKAGPGQHDASTASEPQQSSDTVKTEPAPEVSALISSSLMDQPGHTKAHGEQFGQGWKEGPGAAHTQGKGGGTGGKGAGDGFAPGGTGVGAGGGGGIHGGSDYHYIRETVMKNIIYPEKARRMRQEGRVVLSFVVLESGVTSEVKVINSCGFRLLDESAKEGVMNTTIHKKVPYRVVVTLPITYKLQ